MSEVCIKHIANYWKAKTTISNRLFNQGKFKEALLGYKDALYRAEVLNMNQEDCIRDKVPFMQIYIISYNNLANVYKELKQQEEAENTLKRVVYYLLYLVGTDCIDVNEIQKELKRATVSYLDFVEKNGGDKTQREKLFPILKNQLTELC
ncbi:tetratricopeptide repeat protein [Aquimarina sediminis]|uniref:tetratricopeptide repeat protein n=1 Tax=Aquimarina sediminis TaxID=2070536 RepID=UPI000CA0886E|nr:tetratricopeptide repeat protein [Aquimarina sediminis]